MTRLASDWPTHLISSQPCEHSRGRSLEGPSSTHPKEVGWVTHTATLTNIAKQTLTFGVDMTFGAPQTVLSEDFRWLVLGSSGIGFWSVWEIPLLCFLGYGNSIIKLNWSPCADVCYLSNNAGSEVKIKRIKKISLIFKPSPATPTSYSHHLCKFSSNEPHCRQLRDLP